MFLSFLTMKLYKVLIRFFLNYFTNFSSAIDSLKFYFYYKTQNILLKDRSRPLKIDSLTEDMIKKKEGFPSCNVFDNVRTVISLPSLAVKCEDKSKLIPVG